jgi:hypothetical protein
MPESDRDLVRRAATMRAFYRPGDQADAVDLFDAFVDRLLDLERLGYLTVTTEPEFMLPSGRYRGAQTQLTSRGRAFIKNATATDERDPPLAEGSPRV